MIKSPIRFHTKKITLVRLNHLPIHGDIIYLSLQHFKNQPVEVKNIHPSKCTHYKRSAIFFLSLLHLLLVQPFNFNSFEATYIEKKKEQRVKALSLFLRLYKSGCVINFRGFSLNLARFKRTSRAKHVCFPSSLILYLRNTLQ